MKLLITGVNGFIGSHLLERILEHTDWHVEGFDQTSHAIEGFMNHQRFSFKKGDLFTDNDWLTEAVQRADVVVPLAGVAQPAYYVQRPVWTFELDFEQNLKMVRSCAHFGKRLVFPSTSEVYGMSGDAVLQEDESPLITGPIAKMRWIYSCSKQMMDRMIFAYGQEQNLQFSLFRPFNWVGPRLDSFAAAEKRAARSVTQMIYDVLHRGHVTLVNGGSQRRSFTWVGDGINGLMAILANEGSRADGQIFNVGNPGENYSIKELAEMLIDEMGAFPRFAEAARAARLEILPAEAYYGSTYDDMNNRVPSVEKMEYLLGWKPSTTLRESLKQTLAWYHRSLS